MSGVERSIAMNTTMSYDIAQRIINKCAGKLCACRSEKKGYYVQCVFTILMEHIILANTKSQKHTPTLQSGCWIYLYFILSHERTINSTMKYCINNTNECNFECCGISKSHSFNISSAKVEPEHKWGPRRRQRRRKMKQ